MRESLLVFVFTIFCCESRTSSLIRTRGNDTIIALLSVHTEDSNQCSSQLNFKPAVESQALVYAVQKLNSDPNFDDVISLGLDIEEICDEKAQTVLDAMNTFFKRYKNGEMRAFVTDLSDFLTQLVVHKSPNIPLFTLGSQPNDNGAFYLEPKYPRIGKALAKLVEEFNWKVYDVLVANASSYEYFKDAIKPSNVCENRVFNEKFISSYSTDNETYPLLVFSDSLKTLKNLPAHFEGRDVVIAGEFLPTDERFAKTLALTQRVADLAEFGEFLEKSARTNTSWFGRLIRDSAQFKDCAQPGSESCWSEILAKLSGELRHAGKVIDAVYAIAHALKNTRKRPIGNDDIISTPEFTSGTGNKICFSPKKDLKIIEYSVYDLAKTPSALLGTLQTFPTKTTAELSLDEVDLSRDTTGCIVTCPEGTTPVPSSAKCCVTCDNTTACEKGLRLSKDGSKCVEVRLDYLKWKHPLSIVIFILVLVLFCVLLYLVNIYHKKAQSSAILTSKLATILLLLSLFITLIYPLLPIIKPGTSSCNACVFGFIQALGIPLCILISRSNSYFKRFRQEDGTLRRKVCRSNPQNLIAIFLILFQVTLSIIFVAVSSAHVVHYDTSDPYVDYIECSTFTGSEFLFPFFYTILLALIFTVKNFGAETNERDTYESHFTAIFFFGFYVLSFLNIVIVYGVHGKAKVMLLCVLGILHLLNFLSFLFFPKIYVIVFKRDPIRFSPFPLNSGDREVLILNLSDMTADIEEKKPRK